MYVNKTFLYGNLTRDPELRSLQSGSSVVSFSIATNRTYKDKNGQKQDATEFHNIVAFGRPAELIAQYMKKGRPLFVEGRLQTRSWDDKETGKKNYRTEIVVENFQFGDGGSRGATLGSVSEPKEEGSNSGEEIQYPDEEINPEDIPF